MNILRFGRLTRVALFLAALGLLTGPVAPSLALDGTTTISDVSGKRVKLYSNDSDRKAVERVKAEDIKGSPVVAHTSRRIQIEFGGKTYWVDAYKVKTSPPLNLKEVPVGCTNLAMSSTANSYSTARGSGKSGGCN